MERSALIIDTFTKLIVDGTFSCQKCEECLGHYCFNVCINSMVRPCPICTAFSKTHGTCEQLELLCPVSWQDGLNQIMDMTKKPKCRLVHIRQQATRLARQDDTMDPAEFTQKQFCYGGPDFLPRPDWILFDFHGNRFIDAAGHKIDIHFERGHHSDDPPVYQHGIRRFVHVTAKTDETPNRKITWPATFSCNKAVMPLVHAAAFEKTDLCHRFDAIGKTAVFARKWKQELRGLPPVAYGEPQAQETEDNTGALLPPSAFLSDEL